MKILSIGNSFAIDTMTHLAKVALDLGVKEVKIACLYIGGCSINRHWNNAQHDLAEYQYYVDEGDGWKITPNVSIRTAVMEEEWDWISIQHGTGDGSFYTKAESYVNLRSLVQHVKSIAWDGAKIAFNMAWVGEKGKKHHEIEYYDGNQEAFFKNIVSVTRTVVGAISEIDMISPTGVAVQNARTSKLSTLTRDHFHLTKDVGRYLASLTFFKALTGMNIETIQWAPNGVSAYAKEVAIESVKNAFSNPYHVTKTEVKGMVCKEIFEKIDELYEKYLDVLEDICNIESPTLYKEGVDKVGAYFMKIAKEHGWEIEVSKQEVSGDAICITMNPEAKLEPVAVSGHMDTVHPVGAFGTPAVRRDEDNIYGPGVTDCKGGIVAAVLAMDALEQCGFQNRPIQLLLQSDEENSSISSNLATINYICDKAKDAVAFLNLEGVKCKSSKAIIQRKGILRYRFHIHGKAVHSSRCYEGANAVAEAAYKIIQLEKMKDENGLTCNCGVISGGTVANTVAEECSFLVDIRFATMEELECVKTEVTRIAQQTTVQGCTCSIETVSYRPPMERCEKNEKLLEKMNAIFKDSGLSTLLGEKVNGGSDAAYATIAGIPCVDGIGVKGDRIHSVEEFAIKKSLAESAKRIAAVIYGI